MKNLFDSYKRIDLDHDQSYSLIFKDHFDSLYNYGIKMTGDSELVKDAIQELFYRIWKNNIDLDSITYLKSYLLKGLRRQILNFLELKYYRMDKTEVEETISLEFSPEDYFIRNQYEENLRNKILHALNQLSRKQREAIYLRYFEELEYEEIAEVMNINLQSAKNNVQRGLASLKDILTILLVFYLLNPKNI